MLESLMIPSWPPQIPQFPGTLFCDQTQAGEIWVGQWLNHALSQRWQQSQLEHHQNMSLSEARYPFLGILGVESLSSDSSANLMCPVAAYVVLKDFF